MSEDRYQDWPDAALVDVKIITPDDKYGELGSLWSAMSLGMELEGGEYMMIASPTIPAEVIKAMNLFHVNPYVPFIKTLTPAPGQSVSKKGRNHFLYSAPRFWGYQDSDARIVRAEIGCHHNFTQTKLGNCYYKYECLKCGHLYKVDSSG